MTGNCKYYKLERYVSFDSGQTWSGTGEYSQGALIESASTDCGFVPPTPIYEWRDITPTSDPNTYICDDCEHDYSQDYLTFRVLGSGNLRWSGSTSSNTLSYSTDGGSTWSSPSSEITVSVNSGDTVLFKGTCIPSADTYDIIGIGRFKGATASFDIEGNVMSLLYGDNFSEQTSLGGKDGTFRELFEHCVTLINAENLSLPATTLAYQCYLGMFADCVGLTTAPTLPATTLANSCYDGMFDGCRNLTTAPTLPATTLANSCYYYMFSDCWGLTTAPSLPATTLANSCYEYMFSNCSSLQTAPELPATTLANGCYLGMFQGCSKLSSITCLATDISAKWCTSSWLSFVASSGTFTTPSSTNWTSGYSGIPSGWTRINA